jgi:hypothetical protein
MKEKFLLHQSTKIHREKNKSKIQNIHCKQRSGQHTLACQKSIKTKQEKPLWIQISCSARDWDGKDYLRIIPRVVW